MHGKAVFVGYAMVEGSILAANPAKLRALSV
jgi:hypothetical protein